MLYVLINGECGEAYNISSDKCNVHLRDFAKACAEYNNKVVIFDLPTEVEKKGFSIATQAILDSTKLQRLGYDPFYDFKNAINRTIKILMDNA